MTATMQKEVERIKAIQRQLQEEHTKIYEDDNLSDEEVDKIGHELHIKMDQAIEAEYDAQIKTIKVNEWFKSFLESFTDCKSQQITLKQAEVFKKNLNHTEAITNYQSTYSTNWNVGSIYTGEYNGKIYELKAFGNGAYLTIRDKVII